MCVKYIVTKVKRADNLVIAELRPCPKSKQTKKPVTAAKLYLRVHALLREIVIKRDGRCVIPHANHSPILQAGHLFTKRRAATRIDLRNVSLQCSGCNTVHAVDFVPYENWFISQFGQAEFDRLKEDSRKEVSLTKDDYRKAILELTDILAYIRECPEWRPRYSQEEILTGAWRK